jgi:hypothetical protein
MGSMIGQFFKEFALTLPLHCLFADCLLYANPMLASKIIPNKSMTALGFEI